MVIDASKVTVNRTYEDRRIAARKKKDPGTITLEVCAICKRPASFWVKHPKGGRVRLSSPMVSLYPDRKKPVAHKACKEKLEKR